MNTEKPKPRQGAVFPMSLWDPDFLEDKTGIRPIRHKSGQPCPKASCRKRGDSPGCHNFDKSASLGYTCLIKGTTPAEPHKLNVCCWYIAAGQSTLVF